MGIRSASSAAKLIASALLLFASAPLLSACAQISPEGEGSAHAPATTAPAAVPAHEALAALGLDTADPRAVVEGLEALPVAERPADLMASVQPTGLLLQPGTPEEVALPFAEGDYYLSVAPYRSETHPCTFHSLTTCLGELRNTEVGLRIADVATGELLVDRRARTADNGFAGVWLPSDRELRVVVEVDGESGEAVVRTGAADPTCLTTIQLS